MHRRTQTETILRYLLGQTPVTSLPSHEPYRALVEAVFTYLSGANRQATSYLRAQGT